jgi:peptidoglycan/LPS O-acetylase OafA/YrhL
MSKSSRNGEIDRLRAVAVIMVLMVHAADFFGYLQLGDKPLREFVSGMSVGVDLFFVISGFVVSGAIFPRIQTAIDRKGQGHVSFARFLKGFYARRVFRILPMSWVVLVLGLTSLFLLNGWTEPTEYALRTAVAALDFSANYFLYFNPPSHYSLSPFGHYWSLAIEEQFYLVYPLFLYLVPSNKRRFMVLGGLLALLTFVVRPLYLDLAIAQGHSRAQYATHFRADGILVGCMLYLLARTPFYAALFPFRQPSKALGTVLSVGAILAMTGAKWVLPPVFWIPMAVLISAFLVALASYQKDMVLAVPGFTGLLGWFGSRSYAIYLINWPALWILYACWTRWLSPGLGLAPPLEACSFMVSWLLVTLLLTEACYRLIEYPLMRYGASLSKELDAVEPGPAGAGGIAKGA